MKVRIKQSDDWKVDGSVGKLSKVSSLLRPHLGGLAMRLQKSANVNLHTGNWLPSTWSGELNATDAGVVNLHWVGDETLSIEDIGRIRKPMVWTLHDMWPFCGAEHYTADDELARWRSGYSKTNRPASEGGLDLDRLIWQRKRRAWKRPMHIVAPSRWLASCARESALFKGWPVSVVPNVLDTATFQPLDQHFCRQVLGLPNNDKQIILFGALGGGGDPRKGYDLLLDALTQLGSRMDPQNMLCVVFGQGTPQIPYELPFPTRWMGHVRDDATLALLYNAADVMVVPSRQENLPQTATESQACGCPVVAFDCTGLRDAVVHRETGYLARAFDTEDMAEGLRWILEDAGRRDTLRQASRMRAVKLWSPEVVVPQYLSVYQSMIEHG
jgi:glycosyltransferase involved in cell wall biosynthesis